MKEETQETEICPACFGSIIYLVLPNGVNGLEYVLRKREIIFGRNTACDVRIQKTNVSDKHALLTVDNDGLIWLKNLNDSTKIYLNGKELNEDALVGHNNVFAIGHNWFRLEYCPEIAAAFSVSNVRERLAKGAALTDITSQTHQNCNNVSDIKAEGPQEVCCDTVKLENHSEDRDREHDENQPVEGVAESEKGFHDGTAKACLSPEISKKRKPESNLSAKGKKTLRTPTSRSRGQNAGQNDTSATGNTVVKVEEAQTNLSKTIYLSPVMGKTKKLFSVRSSARAAMRRVSIKDSPVVCKMETLDESSVMISEKASAENSKIAGHQVMKQSPDSAIKLSSPVVKCTPSTPKHNVRVLLSPNRLPTSVRRSLKRRLLSTPRRQLLPSFTVASSTAAGKLAEVFNPEDAEKQSSDLASASAVTDLDNCNTGDIVEEVMVPTSNIIESVTIASAAKNLDDERHISNVSINHHEPESCKSESAANADASKDQIIVQTDALGCNMVLTSVERPEEIKQILEEHSTVSVPKEGVPVQRTTEIVQDFIDTMIAKSEVICVQESASVDAVICVQESATIDVDPECLKAVEASDSAGLDNPSETAMECLDMEVKPAMECLNVETVMECLDVEVKPIMECMNVESVSVLEHDEGNTTSSNLDQELISDKCAISGLLPSNQEENVDRTSMMVEEKSSVVDVKISVIESTTSEDIVRSDQVDAANSTAVQYEDHDMQFAQLLDEGSLYPKLPRKSFLSSSNDYSDVIQSQQSKNDDADASGLMGFQPAVNEGDSSHNVLSTQTSIPEMACNAVDQSASSCIVKENVGPIALSDEALNESCPSEHVQFKDSPVTDQDLSDPEAKHTDDEAHDDDDEEARERSCDIAKETPETVNTSLKSCSPTITSQVLNTEYLSEECSKSPDVINIRTDMGQESTSKDSVNCLDSEFPQALATIETTLDVPTTLPEQNQLMDSAEEAQGGSESISTDNAPAQIDSTAPGPEKELPSPEEINEEVAGIDPEPVLESIPSIEIPTQKEAQVLKEDEDLNADDSADVSVSAVPIADTRCQGSTRQGARCKKQAKEGWCWQHRPAATD